jgi:hypothetical protein
VSTAHINISQRLKIDSSLSSISANSSNFSDNDITDRELDIQNSIDEQIDMLPVTKLLDSSRRLLEVRALFKQGGYVTDIESSEEESSSNKAWDIMDIEQ